MGMWNIKYPYVNDEILNLDWIIAHFNEFIEAIDGLEDWKTSHEAEYLTLKKLYDDIVSGNFPESMIKAMEDWWLKNAFDLVGELVKTVVFGISSEGYFMALIPKNLENLKFGTIQDGELYGHLTLTYE